MSFELASGAEARWTNPGARRAVVCVNGGTAAELPGTWSASVEWLVQALAPRFAGLSFLEVRYRLKSWRRLELCIEDDGCGFEPGRVNHLSNGLVSMRDRLETIRGCLEIASEPGAGTRVILKALLPGKLPPPAISEH